MKNKMRLVAVLLLLLFSLSCFGHEIVVSTDKSVYGPGEEIIIINNVKNSAGENKGFIIETEISGEGFRYWPTVFRSGAPFSAKEEKEITFELGVIETMPEGRYKITSTLFEGETKLEEATAFFEVKGTLSIIDLELLTCKDSACNEMATVFYKGETAFLDYRSSIEGLNVSAAIVLPDGSEQQISLPSSHLMDTAGIYFLKATASKDGYKAVSRQIEFGALEEEVKVVEQRGALPVGEEGETGLLLLIGIAVIIALLAVVLVLKFLRRKSSLPA